MIIDLLFILKEQKYFLILIKYKLNILRHLIERIRKNLHEKNFLINLFINYF